MKNYLNLISNNHDASNISVQAPSLPFVSSSPQSSQDHGTYTGQKQLPLLNSSPDSYKANVALPSFTAFNNVRSKRTIQKPARACKSLRRLDNTHQQQQFYDTPPLTNNRVLVKNANPPSSPLVSIQAGRGHSTTGSLDKPPSGAKEKLVCRSPENQTLSSPENYLVNNCSPVNASRKLSHHDKMSIKAMLSSVSPADNPGNKDEHEHVSNSDIENESQSYTKSFQEDILSSPQYFNDSRQYSDDESGDESIPLSHSSPINVSMDQDQFSEEEEDDGDDSNNDREFTKALALPSKSFDQSFRVTVNSQTENSSHYELKTASNVGNRSPTIDNIALTPGSRKLSSLSIDDAPASVSSDLEGYYIPGVGLPSPCFEDLAMLYGLGAPIPRESVSPTMGTKAAAKIREKLRQQLQMQEESQNALRQKSNQNKNFVAQSPANSSLTIVPPYEEPQNIQAIPNQVVIEPTTDNDAEGPRVEVQPHSQPYHSSSEITDNHTVRRPKKVAKRKMYVSKQSPVVSEADEESRMNSSFSQSSHNETDCVEDNDELVDEDTTFIPAATASDGVVIVSDHSPFKSHFSKGMAADSINICSATKSSQNEFVSNTIASRIQSRRTKSMPPGVIPPCPQDWSSPISSPASASRSNRSVVMSSARRSYKVSKKSRHQAFRTSNSFYGATAMSNQNEIRFSKSGISPPNVSPQKGITTTTPQFDPENVNQALSKAMQKIQHLEQENNTLRQDSLMMRSWAQNMTRMVGSINRQFDVVMNMMENINVERVSLMNELESGTLRLNHSSSVSPINHLYVNQQTHYNYPKQQAFESIGVIAGQVYPHHLPPNSNQKQYFASHQLSGAQSSTFPTPSPMQVGMPSAPSHQYNNQNLYHDHHCNYTESEYED